MQPQYPLACSEKVRLCNIRQLNGNKSASYHIKYPKEDSQNWHTKRDVTAVFSAIESADMGFAINQIYVVGK